MPPRAVESTCHPLLFFPLLLLLSLLLPLATYLVLRVLHTPHGSTRTRSVSVALWSWISFLFSPEVTSGTQQLTLRRETKAEVTSG